MLNLTNRLYLYLSISFLFLFSGCIPVLIGAGAVGGYTLSNDAAAGKVSHQYQVVWNLCLDTLEGKEANFLVTDQSRGYIKAVVAEHAVSIRINSISRDTQRLKVAARRYYLPKPQFAQKLFFEIVNQLE